MDNSILETSIVSEINGLAEQVQSLKETPEVKEYLILMNQAELLEKKLKEIVEKELVSFDYYDPQKESMVRISPVKKTTYQDIDADEVLVEFGKDFIEYAPNLKMMQASPKCASYLEKHSVEKIIPTKRVIK